MKVFWFSLMSFVGLSGCASSRETTPQQPVGASDTQTYWRCVSETVGRSGEQRSIALEACMQRKKSSADSSDRQPSRP